MADPISLQQGIQQIAEQTVQDTSSGMQSQPGEGAVNKFQEAMNGGAVDNINQTQNVNEVSQPDNIEPTEKTMGDSLLEGMEKSRTSYEDRLHNINEIINKTSGETMTPQEMMKMQFELMELNLQQDLTSKVADKSSQGVQTLFKNQ
jgi:type III secretion system YscI/HrpB-like protein